VVREAYQIMKLLILFSLVIGIGGCDRPQFPLIEGKAAKICIDAGLVPDTHEKPYRCYIDENDSRLRAP
jgi:hypothetical protein